MEFDNNSNNIYCDPNAYIQTSQKLVETEKIKKVVFQEPYENLPTHYINNNFKKHDCDCVYKPKEEKPHKPTDCKPKHNSNFLGFDLKNLLPLLSGFLGGNCGRGIGNILSVLNNQNASGGGLDFPKLISTFMTNGGLNLFNKKTNKKEEKIKSTDLNIEDYIRVE